jgi:hypothetical protein
MSIPGTLIIDFVVGLKENEVYDILDEHSLRGIKVSMLKNRYAVDIPIGKEKYFFKILESINDVELVHPIC